MARNDGLRDYQQEMKLRLFEEWELHRSVMVQMPTGTGKTHLLAAVVKEFLCGGGVGMRVWIVAHRRELVEQIEETVARYGMGKEPDKSAKNGRTGKDSMPEESGRVRVFVSLYLYISWIGGTVVGAVSACKAVVDLRMLHLLLLAQYLVMVMLRIKLWSSLDLVFHHLVLISELA